MKNQLYKDKNKRILNFKYEQKQIILKSINKNIAVSKPTRWNSSLKFIDFETNSFDTRIVNRCILTGRKNKVNHFKFSRLSFLKLVRNGLIFGLKKSTW